PRPLWRPIALKPQRLRIQSSSCVTARSKKLPDADMPLFLLFYRLMVRPLFREPVRTMLTILAIALGVGVVLAIDLAGGAATGSFHSSMESLAGDNDLEIVTSGGVPESAVGKLATLPYAMRISPRIEDYAVIVGTKKSLPLIGLDLIAEGNAHAQSESQAMA